METITALDRLNRSMAKTSLDDLVAAKTKRSLLLVDCSGSMGAHIMTGGRRIDALRKIVAGLLETHPVPVAAFGLRGSHPVDLVDVVPEPAGSTPMDLAIDYGRTEGATHLVVVTDGEPNSVDLALDAARRFGGPIDCFYVGDGNDFGLRFCQQLAKLTGGTANLSDLGKPKELAGQIRLLIGDGTDQL
jgi:Mg-chelatase subunit ChlD